MDEGRKRVLGMIAGILVTRHIRTADELFDCKSTPRTESLIAAAVQWAERIMRKVDNVFSLKRMTPAGYHFFFRGSNKNGVAHIRSKVNHNTATISNVVGTTTF